MKKRILSGLLAFAMIFGFAGVSESSQIFVQANAQVVAENVVENKQESAPYYTTVDGAKNYLKSQLKNRKKNITFKVTNKVVSSLGGHKKALSRLYDKVCEYNGKPTEGDYIRYSCLYMSSQISTSNYRTYTFKYTVNYSDTLAQERALNKKVSAVIKSLNLKGKTRYQKFKKIYDYVCKNVKYDYSFANTSHSAYAALCKKKAVCQGYATLMYRLLLSQGIGCRIISNSTHAWIIVKMSNGKYYNCDPTWDAQLKQKGIGHWYMLRCNKNFPEHNRGAKYKTKAFNQKFKMAVKDYSEAVGELNKTKKRLDACSIELMP